MQSWTAQQHNKKHDSKKRQQETQTPNGRKHARTVLCAERRKQAVGEVATGVGSLLSLQLGRPREGGCGTG
jgi:hypothetical protein